MIPKETVAGTSTQINVKANRDFLSMSLSKTTAVRTKWICLVNRVLTENAD